MQKKLQLTQNEHLKLKKYCEKKGIEYLSSAFDIASLSFLNFVHAILFNEFSFIVF